MSLPPRAKRCGTTSSNGAGIRGHGIERVVDAVSLTVVDVPHSFQEPSSSPTSMVHSQRSPSLARIVTDPLSAAVTVHTLLGRTALGTARSGRRVSLQRAYDPAVPSPWRRHISAQRVAWRRAVDDIVSLVHRPSSVFCAS